jgi:magnesium transporter
MWMSCLREQVGIIVGLLSTSIQSLGLTLQRKSHLIEDAKDDVDTRRPAYKRRKWQLGMLMFVVSNIVGSTIQITTLPLPVLSTLQASGLVFNTLFATLLLKEPFTRYSLIGTILTCAGAALIATFGAIGEPAHNLGQLLELLARWQFIVWMSGTLVVVVATILLAHILKLWSSHKHIEHHFLKRERPRSGSSGSDHGAPNGHSIKRSFTASLPRPLQIRVSRLRLARGLSYGLISGILSAHSLLVAKSAVELIVRTVVDRINQFNRFQSWLILLGLLLFALTQLYYLHLGLRLCSTSVLYPFVFCVYNIIAILDGLIYFHQVSRLTALQGGLIALGTVVLLLGVFALSWRLDDGTPEEVAQAAVPPQTPLTPGMGIVRSSEEELERESLLPTTRSRSGTASSRRSFNEQTPLLNSKKRRALTLAIQPPLSDSNTQDLWAELDDEEGGDDDYLASLPRAPSPFLTSRSLKRSKRNSHDSFSSQAVSVGSRDGVSPGRDSPSPIGKARSSSGESPAPRRSSMSGAHGRTRSASVRFADEGVGQPSRYNKSKTKEGRESDKNS